MRAIRGVVAIAVAALGLFAVAPGVAIAAPPANDDFASATAIDPAALPFSDTVVNAEATLESGEQLFCAGGSHTVWYSFAPTTTGVYQVDTAFSFFDSSVTVYQQTASGLGGLSFLRCSAFGGAASFTAEAGTTYYFQANDHFSGGGTLHLNLQAVPAPANDDFANAAAVQTLPYSQGVDTTAATKESGEPAPCGSTGGTVWYAYAAPESGSVMASFSAGFGVQFAAYTGSSLADLTAVGCNSGRLTVHVDAGRTYYFQVGAIISGGGPITFQLVRTPDPVAQFGVSPPDPSVFDTVQFFDQSFDPGGLGFESQAWSFGDGSAATGCCPTHRYAADGDYTVRLDVKTPDGRAASATRTLSVRTHDVAITKLTVPQSARSGQTRAIDVSISNTKYAETVQVQVFRNDDLIGSSTQQVPVRGGGRTTSFAFVYTFTPGDAALGKVTFKAVATLVGARDALPSDNTAIAFPTKVTR